MTVKQTIPSPFPHNFSPERIQKEKWSPTKNAAVNGGIKRVTGSTHTNVIVRQVAAIHMLLLLLIHSFCGFFGPQPLHHHHHHFYYYQTEWNYNIIRWYLPIIYYYFPLFVVKYLHFIPLVKALSTSSLFRLRQQHLRPLLFTQFYTSECFSSLVRN